MLILFLDDSERRIQVAEEYFVKEYEDAVFCVAMTADTAIEYLRLTEEPWDIVMLDHDLGGNIFQNSEEENCGMSVVRYIERTHPQIKRIIIHSWNIPAGREMQDRLHRAGYDAAYQPFGG